MDIDPKLLDAQQQYKLMTGSVVPRPIALVSTLGAYGVNAAPYSFFNVVANAPPVLAFSAAIRPDGSPKDTVRNIIALPEFVVHICSYAMGAAMQLCAENFDQETSEVTQAGFTLEASTKIRPPRIREAPVQMECKLVDIVTLGRYRLVLGEVVMLHFHEGMVDDHFHVDTTKLDAIGRSSGASYIHVKQAFNLKPTPFST